MKGLKAVTIFFSCVRNYVEMVVYKLKEYGGEEIKRTFYGRDPYRQERKGLQRMF